MYLFLFASLPRNLLFVKAETVWVFVVVVVVVCFP